MKIGKSHRIEKQSKHRGYTYLVIAMDLGHRCGYVRIPKSHPLYGMNHDAIDLNVHGGLTFSGSFYDQTVPGYFIGFDCGHVGDKRDESIMSKEILRIHKEIYNRTGISFPGETIKTKKYVENECKNLIDQLIDSQFNN